jgi:hypothetical protein
VQPPQPPLVRALVLVRALALVLVRALALALALVLVLALAAWSAESSRRMSTSS